MTTAPIEIWTKAMYLMQRARLERELHARRTSKKRKAELIAAIAEIDAHLSAGKKRRSENKKHSLLQTIALDCYFPFCLLILPAHLLPDQ